MWASSFSIPNSLKSLTNSARIGNNWKGHQRSKMSPECTEANEAQGQTDQQTNRHPLDKGEKEISEKKNAQILWKHQDLMYAKYLISWTIGIRRNNIDRSCVCV